MANDNNELLSQQRIIIADINNLYKQINDNLLRQQANQEMIAKGGIANSDDAKARLEQLRADLGSTAQVAAFTEEEIRNAASAGRDLGPTIGAGAGEAVDGLTTVGEVAGGLTQTILQVKKGWDSALKLIAENAESSLRRSYSKIQDYFGGITLGAMNSTDGTIVAGNQMAGAFQKVAKEIDLAGYSFATFGETGRTATFPLQAALGSTEEIMATFNQLVIQDGLINGMSMAELAMSSAGEESIKQMRTVSLALGLNAEETSTFVSRQISLTGKAGTDMLAEAALSAKAVAKIVGSSAKVIGKSMQAIIADTERFGNVTVDEAARISGTLAELGIDYEDLGGMVNKYMSFEGAVDSISALTTVFGVQLDSMEMMRLANTDQEGFLRKMREQFIMTGKSVDDMNLAEKRLIKSQLGLKDIESVERLFDPGRALTSLEELTQATADMAPEDASERTKKLFEEMGDEMLSLANLTEFSTKEMQTFFQEGLTAPLREAKIALEQLTAKKAGAGMELGAPALEAGQAQAVSMQESFVESMPKAIASVETLIASMTEGFTAVVELLKGPPALLNSSDSAWDITFRDRAPKSIGKTTEALLTMTKEMKSSFEGITEGPLDGFLKALGDGIPESMAIASGEMAKFASMSDEELKELMKDTDGMGQKLAKQLGFLQQRGGKLTESALKELAASIGFTGDDWKDKMDTIMSTQADEAGAAQALQGDAVTTMLQAYKDMGVTMDDMGGADGEWAKAYAAEYSLSPEELTQALSGEADIGSIVRGSLDEANVAAAEAKAEEKSRTERLREEYEAESGATEGSGREQSANIRRNTKAINDLATAVGLLKDSMSDRPIVINLAGQPITDYIVDSYKGRTSTSGNTLALEPQ